MKIRRKQQNNKIKYYQLWLSKIDTDNWAHRPNCSWPCSQVSGHRLFVCVDKNGLVDFTIDGKTKDIDSNELSAVVADHLPNDCKHLWPCWN